MMNAARTWALILGLGLFMSGHAAARDDAYAAVRETLESCVTCHGENGASTQPEFPILAGQHLYYLYVQLKDFKSGYRKNDVMGPIAAGLDKTAMLTIAKYFSEQTWPNTGFRADPAIAGKGETAAAAGQCVKCHFGGYEGDSRIPRLAGQHPEYLKKTMLDFRDKVRNNLPAMSSLVISYSDADIAAMAEYLAGF